MKPINNKINKHKNRKGRHNAKPKGLLARCICKEKLNKVLLIAR